MSGGRVDDRRQFLHLRIDYAVVDDYGKAVGPYGLLVYMGLARFADWNTGEAFPGRRKLAGLLGISTSSVDKGLDAIEAAGLIRVDARYREDGSRASNVYTLLHVTPPPSSVAHPPPPVTDRGGVSETDTVNNLQTTNIKQQTSVTTPAAAKPQRTAIALALYDWLGLGDGAGASKGVHVNVQRIAGVYLAAGETDAEVRADAARWATDDWRGASGQPPTPSQAQDWRVKCRTGRTGSVKANGNAAVKADTDRAVRKFSPEEQARRIAEVKASMPGAFAQGGAG